MKPLRFIHALVGAAAIAVVGALVWGILESFRNQKEASNIEAVFAAIEAQLGAYHRTNGAYPSSLTALAFEHPVVQNVNYRPTQLGYELSYRGEHGYTTTKTFASEPPAQK